MSIEQISAIENLMQLGFTLRQSEFLYLVGTQSGVFTTEHYRIFTGNAQRGGPQLRLLARLEKHRFVMRIALNRRDQFFHLSNKAFYRAILTEDSRLRRGMSPSLLRQRLQYMDYVVRHPDARYLATESQKCEYLAEQFGISEALFPRQEYSAKNLAHGSTVRFFPERYPMFIMDAAGYAGLGIVYGEDPANRFASFRRFVLSNQTLFSPIPAIHFVYVSASSTRAYLASALLKSLFSNSHPTQNDDMQRYFRLRRLYENNARESFTNADYAFWTRNHKQYSESKYEPMYLEFCSQSSLSAASFVVPDRTFNFIHFTPTSSLREGF